MEWLWPVGVLCNGLDACPRGAAEITYPSLHEVGGGLVELGGPSMLCGVDKVPHTALGDVAGVGQYGVLYSGTVRFRGDEDEGAW